MTTNGTNAAATIPARRLTLGPGDTWKTGQRVATAEYYRDQHGFVSWHEEGTTFPPCIGRKGECAYRKLVDPAATGRLSA